MSQVIPLGAPGQKRYFVPATETTARHDGWVMVQLADAGLLQFAERTLSEKDVPELVLSILRSGKRELILAGLLVEQGVPWSVETAEKNAEWFANLTDRESKAALQTAFLPVLVDFFRDAMPSLGHSPNASAAKTAPPAPASPPNGDALSTTPEARAPAGNGSRVPGSSRTGIRRKQPSPSTGRSSTSSTPTAPDFAPSHENSTTPS